MDIGLNSSVTGISQAFKDHAARADRISRAAEHEDLAKDMVGQIEDSAIVKANVAVIKTHDEMLGSLLDLFS